MSSISAYDVVARKHVDIVPSSMRILKKEGTNRYRIAGKARNGHKVSRFVSQTQAKKIASEHDKKICIEYN